MREIKKRIQATLEIPDEDFKQQRFTFHRRQGESLEYLRGDDEIVTKFRRSVSRVSTNKKYLGHNESFIALEHENTKPNPKPWQRVFRDAY